MFTAWEAERDNQAIPFVVVPTASPLEFYLVPTQFSLCILWPPVHSVIPDIDLINSHFIPLNIADSFCCL